MRLQDPDGTAFELTVTGYQFPDADDPRQRYSWHMLKGKATNFGETWEFRYPALTCSETPTLSAWLREAADWLDAEDGRSSHLPELLTFTEPNLAFRAVRAVEGAHLILEIDLDQDFRRSGNQAQGAPLDTLRLRCGPADLREAAATWDTASSPYPDGLA